MNWTKYGVITLLLFIMFSASLFGAHFGYTVNGVPKGMDATVSASESKQWSDWGYGTVELTVSYWGRIFGGAIDAVVPEGIQRAFAFFWYMTTFQIDDMPDFVSAIFVIMSVLVILIIFSLVRGSD